MDPLTAGLNLATELLKARELLFAALPADQQAARASDHFEALQKIQDFAQHVIDLFHK